MTKKGPNDMVEYAEIPTPTGTLSASHTDDIGSPFKDLWNKE